jgi:hypothetical protein
MPLMPKFAPTQDMIDVFLAKLCASNEGKIFLVNMWHSVAEHLISRRVLKSFVTSCCKLQQLDPSKPISQILQIVCRGDDDKVSRSHLLLNRVHEKKFDGKEWSTVMTWDNWLNFHVNGAAFEDPTTVFSTIGIPPSTPATPSSKRLIDSWVNGLTSIPNWWRLAAIKDGGTLGKPGFSPMNCWISSDYFQANTSLSNPTKTRDALGLIDFGVGVFLLRYRFNSVSARRSAQGNIARPTVFDLGNRRFRVRQRAKIGLMHRKHRWGTTVNLEKLRKIFDKSTPVKKFHYHQNNVDGLPERVSRALPIKDLEAVSLQVLGPISDNLSLTNDLDFLKHLLGNENVDEEIDRIAINVKKLLGY